MRTPFFRKRSSKKHAHQIRRQRERLRLIEQLEPRLLLNADWQNPARPLDVNNDRLLTPNDALQVINRLNARLASVLPERVNPLDHYYDTNGDGFSSPIDALLVINELNLGRGNQFSPRFEGGAEVAPAGFISIPFTVLPGSSGELVELSTRMTINTREYNELGLFVVDDPGGSVAGLSPSSPGYADAVFRSSQRQVLYSQAGDWRATHDVVFPAGNEIYIYVLQAASDEGDPHSHLRVRESGDGFRIGWEEHAQTFTWPQVGDRGYDDVVVDVLVGAPYTGQSAPNINFLPPQTVDELTELRIQAIAMDAELPNDELTWSLDTAPAGAHIDAGSGLFTWTPTEEQGPASFPVVVRVTDQAGQFDTESFTVEVREVNLPPVWEQLPDRSLFPGDTIVIATRATDADIPSNHLTFSLGAGAPPGATIDPVSGVFTWTAADVLEATEFPVTIRALDDGSPRLSALQTFVITVRQRDDSEFDEQLTGWQIVESGGSPAGRGTVVGADGQAKLTEGDSLLVGLRRAVTVSDTVTGVVLQFEKPEFDTTSTERMRDAFEVVVTDMLGNPIAMPYASGRSAAMNWSEDIDSALGSSLTLQSGGILGANQYELVVNLAHLSVGTEVLVTVRLVNNDGDDNSSVVLTAWRELEGLEPGPEGLWTEASRATGTQGPLDLPRLQELSSSLRVEYGRTSFTEDRSQVITEVSVTNLSSQAVTGRLVVVIDQVSDLETFAMRPDGILSDGRPYVDLTAQMDGPLRSGESTRPRELRFTNPGEERFTYRLSALGEVNRAPSGFSTTPLDRIEGGRTYQYTARAMDPDGDTLDYSIVAGPAMMTVDAQSGKVTWVTSPDDVGNHRVTLHATDPFGQVVEQSFTIEVRATLANRPPNFVTEPVTDAIASAGFEVATVATGAGPSVVTTLDGFVGPRLISLDAWAQTASTYTPRMGNGYDWAASVSTGEPLPTDDPFQAGYSVDLGLEPFTHPSDRNDLLGLDQGDFDGDGILDLVTAVYTNPVGGSPPSTYELVVVLGDGDGNFGTPLSIPLRGSGQSQFDYRHLRAADIDGDGDLDLLLLERQSGSLITVLGNGDGTFQPLVETLVEPKLHDFRVGDVDSDGVLDLYGRTAGFSQFGWMRSLGDGTFGPFQEIASGDQSDSRSSLTRPYQLVDFDGDGDMDVIWSRVGTAAIDFLANDGEQGFTLAHSIAPQRTRSPMGVTASAMSIWVGDFTGDGRFDILYSPMHEYGFGMYVATETPFEYEYRYAFDAEDNARPFNWGIGNPAGDDAPVDIDGDGDLDVVLGSAWTSANNIPIFVLRNNGGVFDWTPYATVNHPGLELLDEGNHTSDVGGVVVGDYNRDGVMDLAHFTHGDTGDFNGVGILPGTRPGEFAGMRAVAYPGAWNYPDAVLVADFNGDGILDVTTTSPALTAIGRGDGTFDPPIPSYQAYQYTNSRGLAVDFDLDGLADTFTTYGRGFSTQRYRALMGNGDGTFETTYNDVIPNLLYGPTHFDTADFNLDGHPDVLTRSACSPAQLNVLLYNPDERGTFTITTTMGLDGIGIDCNGFVNATAIADYTGDGIPDLAIIEKEEGIFSEFPVRLVVLEGLGDGTFELFRESYPFAEVASHTPSSMVAGDVNGDGLIDLVSSTASDRILVHLATGPGTFADPVSYYSGRVFRGVHDLYLLDVDGDGRLDLVSTDSRDTSITFRRGFGDGTFSAPKVFDDLASHNDLTFADIDHDGHIDIIRPPYDGIWDTVAIMSGARDTLVDGVAVDLNGDGNQEWLAVNEANDRLKLFVGDNLGGLTRQQDLLTGRAPRAAIAIDLDGDGAAELITANRAGRSLSLFTGSLADGYIAQEIHVGSGPIDLASADLDGDGMADLVVLDEVANALWVYAGNGTTTLADPVAVALGDLPGRLTLADATGDGVIDAVVTLPDSNRLMVLAGDGEGGFLAPRYVDVDGSPSDVAVVDLNEDGWPDLAVVVPDGNRIDVLYGRGSDQFSSPQSIGVGVGPSRIVATDVDGDGRVDFVVTNTGESTASVIYNRFDPNQVYRYPSEAVDPDGDTLTYAIAEGPGGLLINGQTGELFWAASPDQVGIHDVTITADDGRGGTATQTFQIDVRPARENAGPLIASEPITQIGAADQFDYQVQAIDADGDPLRYRIIDGPEGATIDPVTGELHWDASVDGALKFAPNNNLNTSGSVLVPSDDSLRPASVTVEGWYNFPALPPGNGREYLIRQAGARGEAYALYNTGNRQLELEMQFADYNDDFRFPVPFVPEIDRWYHFAITIDDASRQASIYVDGVAVGTKTIPQPIHYSPTANAQVGNASVFFSRSIVDNVRIWNVARTAEEIREGMSRQYDGDPRLVLDYRFESTDTLTVRDHSPAGNHGVRLANAMLPMRVPGLADPGTTSFTIGVEDGRGGVDVQTFSVTVLIEQRGAITGQLFHDADGDGARATDGSEEPLEGWNVYIDVNGNQYADADEPQTTTGADGSYRFEQMLPGDYPLRVAPVAGYQTPASVDATVVANQETALDWAIEQLALGQIRGGVQTDDGRAIAHLSIFADLDGDGLRDDDEPTTVTDASGNYALAGLAAGEYTILPELLAGWGHAAGSGGLTVALDDQAITTDHDFTLRPMVTSVGDGLHFVTTPNASVVARDVYRYTSLAVGIGDPAVRYDLPMAPEGMTVDPITGRVAWRPSIDQVGEHTVVLRATSENGSIALHDFAIDVAAPNYAPTFVQLPPPTAYVGMAYAYRIVAQDVESDALTYALVDGPAGATVDADGRLSWTPAAEESVAFIVQATDAAGNATSTSFTVAVRSDAPDPLPLTVTPPRTNAAVLAEYLGRVRGVDGLGRDVSWTLQSGPAGLTVTDEGHIRWTPTIAQLGTHELSLTATTADGDVDPITLSMTVTGSLVNASPVIDSTPVRSAVVGRPYEYDMRIDDTDHDLLAFTLLDGPVGMSIDPSLGTLRWTPGMDQLGEAHVQVRVADVVGAEAIQEFTIRVGRVGGPPSITSVPPTEVAVGATYFYTVVANDAQGDSLTYRLLTAPAGMTIVESTGEITYTPDASAEGWQTVAIEVSDGTGGAVTQAFAILVLAGANNLPPEIVSQAPRFGAVGGEYRYAIVASDPEGTPLVYSVTRGPDGLTVDADTGVVVWTPTAGQVGKHVVTLRVTDAEGAAAIESFELDVLAENRAPTFSGEPPAQIAAGTRLVLDMLASDPDLDALVFELVAGPAGAQVDAFGRVTWTTTNADVGTHAFEVRARDPRGGVATRSFSIDVVVDTVPPVLSLIHSPGDDTRNMLPWQGPFTVYVRAFDNVELASLTLQANGVDIPLSAAGTATFTFEQYGFTRVFATATAVDVNGNVTTRTTSFDYDIPEGWGPGGGVNVPTATITSPADDAAVVGMVAIVGTAAHEDFAQYRLSYRRADHDTYTEIVRSDTSITGGELGVWDTSLLENDQYFIRLEVVTTEGVANVVEHSVGLGGELKLGNFRLSFTDMVIPVAGIPIQVTRIYDSLRSDREGDFGYGWRLEYRDTDLRVGLPDSGLEDIGIHSPLRQGVKVYLNVPGVGRQGFTFTPNIRVLPGFGGNNLVLAQPRFTPDPGVTATLSTGTSGYLQVNEMGELFAPGNIPYNPASPDFGGAYVLTTREGITYRIDGSSGKLTSATDLNGNRVHFGDNGIYAEAGDGSRLGIEVRRDALGRIMQIVDPNGESIRYRYTGGDLTVMIDPRGYETRFTYSMVQPHYLVEIHDPLGRPAVRTEFDEAGRIASMTDALGNAVRLDFDPGSLIEEVEDAFGNLTLVSYDQMGNKTASVDALGNRFEFQYDAGGNLLATVNPLGERHSYTRNAAGNVIAETDAAGFTSHYQYDARGRLVGTTTPLGQTVQLRRDERGNLIGRTDPNGAVTSYVLDARGNVLQEVDPLGGVTSMERNAHGWIVSVTNELGNIENREYDSAGRLIRSRILRIVNGQSQEVTVSQSYDASGNVVSATAPSGNLSLMQYDGANNLVKATDSLGRETVYGREVGTTVTSLNIVGTQVVESELDARGQILNTALADGQELRYEYDALGRALRMETHSSPGANDLPIAIEYDALGRPIRITRGDTAIVDDEYDSRGNVVASRGGGAEATNEYDAAGRLIREVIDGDETRYAYDVSNNLVRIDLSGGGTIEYAYDIAGRLISERVNGEMSFRYQYDAAGQLVGVVDGLGHLARYTYDALGNVASYIDALGRETTYEYDMAGRLTAIVAPDGGRRLYEYDLASRVTSKQIGETAESLTYDDFDRVVARNDGQNLIGFEYDAAGRIERMVDSRGQTNFSYDGLNRLLRRVEPDGAFVEYGYDDLGNITRIATPAGERLYAYNGDGQIVSMTDVDGNSTLYGYDTQGRRVSTSFAGGLVEMLSYGENGAISRQAVSKDGEVIHAVDYYYNTNGRLEREVYSDGAVSSYGYDANGQLIHERHVDAEGEIREIRYQYDAVGNRVRRDDSDTGSTIYRYDQNDRLVEKLADGVTYAYTYDGAGRVLSVTVDGVVVLEYAWSANGRLQSTTRTDGGVVRHEEYLYDGFGVRVGAVVDGQANYYLYDANGGLSEVLEVYDASGEITQVVTQGAGIRATRTAEGVVNSIKDRRDSVIASYDAQGNLVGHSRVDGFGRTLMTSGVNIGGAFLGEWSDELSGLVYLRARYYDPEDGRFLSVDPLEGSEDLPISRHNYLYAENDPIHIQDPTGLSTLTEQLAALTVKNPLFYVGLAQGLVGAAALAFGKTIEWSGPGVSVEVGSWALGMNSFSSEPVANGGVNQTGHVNVLTLSKSVGQSWSLQERVKRKAQQSRVDRAESNMVSARGNKGKAGGNYSAARRELKKARKQTAFEMPLDFLGISFGDSTIYVPSLFGHTGLAMMGAFLGGSVGAKASLGGNVPSLGAASGGFSIAIAACVYGFGVGFTFSDTAISATAHEKPFSSTMPDLAVGFSVNVGVSIPGPTSYRIVN